MRILVIGADGFVGRCLLSELAARERLGDTDIAELCASGSRVRPELPDSGYAASALDIDLTDRADIDSVLTDGWDVIFHLAEVESGEAEADFARGMRTNFFGTFNLFDAIRATQSAPVVVYGSTRATEGSAGPQIGPESSYGAQKAIGEVLLCDYTRRGAMDGRTLRLPTLLVDPAEGARGADAFASRIVREALAGQPTSCPVAETTPLLVCSGGAAAQALCDAAAAEAAALGPLRLCERPALATTVAALLDAVEQTGGSNARQMIAIEPDPAIEDLMRAITPISADAGSSDETLISILEAHAADQSSSG